MFWDWKYKETTTTTKKRYNNLTSRSRESDKCKNNAVYDMQFIYTKGTEGENPLILVNEREKI